MFRFDVDRIAAVEVDFFSGLVELGHFRRRLFTTTRSQRWLLRRAAAAQSVHSEQTAGRRCSLKSFRVWLDGHRAPNRAVAAPHFPNARVPQAVG
jgi:hypothetical protein